uniref:DRBM domain-containing protein n=1 Tax=Ditylenchus dipsaci TaxID=166011 RepID=A0A915CVQ0_9BILA
MDPEYGHHINPVSRLIQVMQMRNEPEPVFKLLGEQGASRYKIFIIEVTCLNFREEGTGPNKKLAKRAAAEAMLNQIGYVKSMPQPGKSILKRKEAQGIFLKAECYIFLNPPKVKIARLAPPSPLKLHPQPWCGNHENNEADSAKKNAYNYGLGKEGVEKTPMCRVAELARYNKLKHEYLVLKEGQEFQSSGASIKKAQQAAASVALDQTTLPIPPIKTKKKRDDINPVILLHQVASRLNITLQCSDQMVQLPVPAPASLNLPVKLPSPPQPISMLQLHTHPIKNAAQKPQLLSAMPSPAPYKWPFVSPATVCPPPFAFLPPNSREFYRPSSNPYCNGQNNVLNNQSNCVQNGNSSRPANYLMSMPPPPLLNGAYKQFCQPLFGGMNGLRSRVLMPKMQHQTIYKAVVRLSDGSEHVTTGPNKQMAKSSAATKALFHLRPLLEKLDAELAASKESQRNGQASAVEEQDLSKITSQEESPRETNSLMSTNSTDSFDDGISSETSNTNSSDSSEADKSEEVNQTVSNEHKNDNSAELKNEVVFKKKKKTKSIISQIHERALRLKMNVEFEVYSSRKGEPHNRKYTLCCRMTSPTDSVVPIVAEGEGGSKKQAKEDACRKIFEKIKGIENDPLRLASLIVKNEKKQHFPSVPKENKRKTIIKDKKMDPEYGHHINPVSRLIQVTQMRNEPEPVFKLLGEQGASRYKIFIIEVTCLNFREEGTGPNKKLAKRAAAEAMLNQIGYVKSMPQPGKSILKRKEAQGIF